MNKEKDIRSILLHIKCLYILQEINGKYNKYLMKYMKEYDGTTTTVP